MLKGGILGFGGVGQLRAHCIRRDYARDDVNVVAAYDIDEAKLRLAREQYGLEAAS